MTASVSLSRNSRSSGRHSITSRHVPHAISIAHPATIPARLPHTVTFVPGVSRHNHDHAKFAAQNLTEGVTGGSIVGTADHGAVIRRV